MTADVCASYDRTPSSIYSAFRGENESSVWLGMHILFYQIIENQMRDWEFAGSHIVRVDVDNPSHVRIAT